MKQNKSFFKTFLAVFLVSLTCQTASSAVEDELPQRLDSVTISLITCGPGQQIWSLYGHTAIRVEDKSIGSDYVVNYGIFSFSQKFFILRFVFGLTDYNMGVSSFSDFLDEYRQEGRWVRQQDLNLTRADKMRILEAFEINYRPENRTYRYNYFYDNCTTRARDIIERNISGEVLMPEKPNVKASYRSMIHEYNSEHPWMRFGKDLLLGVKADFNITPEQQQFLPEVLMKDFDEATVKAPDGSRKKLVSSSEYLLHSTTTVSDEAHTLTPTDCSIILLVITIIICAVEWYRKKIFWPFDALLLAADGLAGLILFAMIFSQHPTVSVNLQILILCPLSIIFALPVVKKLRHGQVHWYLKLMKYLVAVGVIGYAFQKYDDAILILALILLGRIVSDEILLRSKGGKSKQ